MDRVTRFYDHTADSEARRLVKDAYHRIEFDVTMHYLRKHLPGSGHLLDIGGGSGRYAIALAELGYQVTLVDVSRELLKIARREIERSGMTQVIAVRVGDVRDLTTFEDGIFDGVLALGPMYHLPDQGDRSRAMEEIVRVARIGASVFISGISLFGVYKTLLVSPRYEYEFTDENHREMLERGIHRASWHGEPTTFPDAWFCTPGQLRALGESHGLTTIEMAALEGLSSHHREATERLSENDEAWRVWMDILIRTSNEPSILGSSEHILYIGSKG